MSVTFGEAICSLLHHFSILMFIITMPVLSCPMSGRLQYLGALRGKETEGGDNPRTVVRGCET